MPTPLRVLTTFDQSTFGQNPRTLQLRLPAEVRVNTGHRNYARAALISVANRTGRLKRGDNTKSKGSRFNGMEMDIVYPRRRFAREA